ncbi:DUF1501 domain-containing protein [Micromonospora endophytica]|uniref:Uncharacterized protein n=1 Tax=Micromonospora endophytica TaxID=515350 RepID=A0A2W2DE43_9ACTN|nr:DUF1501 domain-containing protein [Micromonospora endophytica]PZF99069.1 hypothetical protein C1I93_06865 [Micromonospora endophytica]RIW41927.1 DUF1501 domain-containing protein [Micromonospora endophytica]BCJ58244.1 hypothetical protein Jiend_16660 [Micromonospora endophytica]
MDALTRRRFLLASGVTGAAALAAGGGALAFSRLLGSAARAVEPPGDTLVVVTLYGGNDGLNTVIPYADPAYHANRPQLAYPVEKVLPLDGALGLNPALTGLRRLWDDKRLGIVLGVGYPQPDRSHFRSMDIWQTGVPHGPVTTGWVGRWLDDTAAPVGTAVSFEPVIPPLLVGRRHIGSCVSYQGLDLPPWVDPGLVAELGIAEPGEPAMQARAASAYADLLTLQRVIGGMTGSAGSPREVPEPPVPATGTGGESALSAQLALVAHCVEVGVPTRVYSVSLGGFDTHADELSTQELLLRQLDTALSAFADRMAQSAAGRRVTVIVYSEFGRRVRANASDGTDHGTAGPVLVLGHQVRGGFHGEQPSLTDLDHGDLKATADFRDVFGSVLGSVLHADPSRYFDGYQPRMLPLVNTG